MAYNSNMNFEVLLDTTQYDKAIKDVEKKAKDLNTNLSTILTFDALRHGRSEALNLVSALKQVEDAAKGVHAKQVITDKTVSNARDLNSILDEASKKLSGMPASVNVTATRTKEADTAARQYNTTLSGTSSLIRTIAQLTGIAFSAATIRRFVGELVEVSGNLEMQRKAMEHILGSAEKGTVIFEQLKELAKPSYFTLPDLTKYAKQLAALSIPYEELFETTRMLGDVSAGLGVSFDRIALAYGHIRSMGFLRGMQARQLTNAGIPIFEELSKAYSEAEGKLVSISEVYERMSKRMITFEDVSKVFTKMTSEGGKFYDMQIALTDTLAGRVNKLRGVWEIAIADLGQANDGVLKGTVNFLIQVVEHLDTIGNVLTPVIAAFGAYYAALMLVNGGMAVMKFTSMATALMGFAGSAAQATVAAKIFGTGLKGITSAMGGIIAVLTLVGTAVYQWWIKPMREARREQEEITAAISKTMAEINREDRELKGLFDTLEKAKNGTAEYAKVRDEILGKYGEYLTAVDKENIAVGNLVGIYEKLSTAIGNAARAQFIETQTASIRGKLVTKQGDILDRIKEVFPKINDDDYSQLTGYVLGTRTKEQLSGSALNYFNAVDAVTGNVTNAVESLRQEFLRTEQEAESAIKRIQEAFNPRGDEYIGPAKPQDFQKIFNGVLLGVNDDALQKRLGQLFGYGNENDWDEYRKRISKSYDELNSQLAGAFNEDRRKPIQQEIDFIEDLDRAFGGHLLSGNKTVHGRETAAEKERRRQEAEAKRKEQEAERQRRRKEQEMKQQISNLQKLRSEYERLAQNPLVGPGNAASVMQQIFGETDMNFEGRIENILKDLLLLNPELDEYAKGVRDAFGKDRVKEYLDGLEALDKYQKSMAGWRAEDFNLGGSGFEFDVRKVISDFSSATGKIANKQAEMERKAELAHKGNTRAIDDEKDAIAGLAKAEIDYEKAKAQARLDNLASSYLKDQYFLRDIDLSHLGDMTIGQLDELKGKLEGIRDSIAIDPETQEKLDRAGLSVEKLYAAIKKALGEKINHIDTEIWKEIGDLAKSAAEEVQDLAGAIAALNDVAGSGNFGDMANGLGEIASMASDVYNAFNKFGGNNSWAGGFAAMVAFTIAMNKKVLELAAEDEKKAVEMAAAFRELAMARVQDNLSRGVDSIFGTNDSRELANAVEQVKNLTGQVEAFKDAADSMTIRTQKMGFWKKLLSFFSGPDDPGKAGHLVVQDVTEGLRGIMGENMYDAYGNLNADTLRKILEVYDKELTNEQREWINDAIAASERYEEAMRPIVEQMKELVGSVAESAADAMIDSWVQSGDAALDYADILDTVARQYAKMAIKSAILDNVFNDDMVKRFSQAFSNGEIDRALGILRSGLQAVQAMAPQANEILNGLSDYINPTGSEGESFGRSLQSMTEETGSLIASYFNAVRADVSMLRAQNEAGWQTVSAIASGFAEVPLPTLANHIAQIEHYSQQMLTTQMRMLSELSSVIGAPGTSGNVVRIEAY